MNIEVSRYLRNVKKYCAKIDRTRESIERLYAQASKCTTSLEGIGGGSSSIQDKMAEIIAKCLDKSEEYVAMIEEYQKLQMQIIDEILSLEDPKYSNVLYKYYVEDKPMEVVSQEMRYDYKYTFVLHGKALDQFYDDVIKRKLNHEQITNNHE